MLMGWKGVDQIVFDRDRFFYSFQIDGGEIITSKLETQNFINTNQRALKAINQYSYQLINQKQFNQ